ncbi:MAG: hypothetical protein CHACPFDD_02400 [Phycisphaerae bacterium]|nr:hypothetical protein [Phycisphaerae bacterium]
MIRSPRLIGAALAFVILLAGCATAPRRGDVQTHELPATAVAAEPSTSVDVGVDEHHFPPPPRSAYVARLPAPELTPEEKSKLATPKEDYNPLDLYRPQRSDRPVQRVDLSRPVVYDMAVTVAGRTPVLSSLAGREPARPVVGVNTLGTSPAAGVSLPWTALVGRSGDGSVRVGYDAPRHVAGRAPLRRARP